MKLLSIQVGLPREVQWQGRIVTMMRTLNLQGDAQADLTVHGGMDKAVRIVEPPRFREGSQQAGTNRLRCFQWRSHVLGDGATTAQD